MTILEIHMHCKRTQMLRKPLLFSVGLILAVLLALGACGGSAKKSSVGSPEPFIGQIKWLRFNATGAMTMRELYDPAHKAYVVYAAGPNGTLGDADDVVANYTTYTFQVVGGKTFALRAVNYVAASDPANPTGDGIWFTTDDQVGSYSDFEVLQTSNGPVAYVKASFSAPTGAGGDGVWFNTDDVATSRKQYTLVSGLLTEEVTTDDVGNHTACTRHTFDTTFTTVPVTHDYWTPGTDGVCFTGADDVMTSYFTQSLNADGDYVVNVPNTAGADGIWKNADDVAGTFSVYNYSAPHTLSFADYMAPGVDLKAGTADDVCNSRSLNFVSDPATNSWSNDNFASANGICGDADDWLSWQRAFGPY